MNRRLACRWVDVRSADLELGGLLVHLLDADLLNVLAGTDHGDEVLDLSELLGHPESICICTKERDRSQKNVRRCFSSIMLAVNTNAYPILAFLVYSIVLNQRAPSTPPEPAFQRRNGPYCQPPLPIQ